MTTTPTTGAAMPEALRLAAALEQEAESVSRGVKYSTARKAAAELRRLHALSAAAPAVAAARPAMPETWHVVAHIKGEPVLSIGYDWVSGRELASEEEHAIVGMAQHLLSFVGYGLPPSDFNPDDDAAHQAQPGAAAPAVAATREPSPTAGMNIAQRILHVGGRNNDAGYVEFGSIQAVEALVRQVLRDIPTPAAVSAPSVPDGWKLGIEAAAKMLEEKADSFAAEHGYNDMGSLSFGQGAHANAKMEWHSSLIELAIGVRAMLAAAPQVPAQEGGAA